MDYVVKKKWTTFLTFLNVGKTFVYIPEEKETGIVFIVNGEPKVILLQRVEGGVQATYQNDEDSEEITFKMS